MVTLGFCRSAGTRFYFEPNNPKLVLQPEAAVGLKRDPHSSYPACPRIAGKAGSSAEVATEERDESIELHCWQPFYHVGVQLLCVLQDSAGYSPEGIALVCQ